MRRKGGIKGRVVRVNEGERNCSVSAVKHQRDEDQEISKKNIIEVYVLDFNQETVRRWEIRSAQGDSSTREIVM